MLRPATRLLLSRLLAQRLHGLATVCRDWRERNEHEGRDRSEDQGDEPPEEPALALALCDAGVDQAERAPADDITSGAHGRNPSTVAVQAGGPSHGLLDAAVDETAPTHADLDWT